MRTVPGNGPVNSGADVGQFSHETAPTSTGPIEKKGLSRANIVVHQAALRLEAAKSFGLIDVKGRRIIPGPEKQRPALASAEVLHQVPHECARRALAAILRPRVDVSKVADAVTCGGEHVGEGRTVPVQQVETHVDAQVIAQTPGVLPAPDPALVAQQITDAIRPGRIRADDDPCLDLLPILERHRSEGLVHCALAGAVRRTYGTRRTHLLQVFPPDLPQILRPDQFALGGAHEAPSL